MVKIQLVGKRFTIGIPNDVARKKKLEKGQEFLWQFNEDGHLMLLPVDD